MAQPGGEPVGTLTGTASAPRVRLNFGDCIAYATAKVAGQPLLSLDRGFAATDVELIPLDR